jgi:hypothetical protein
MKLNDSTPEEWDEAFEKDNARKKREWAGKYVDPYDNDLSKSDGSTAKYYELPDDATELQDLISHKNMNAQDGEIFRTVYRKGEASHSDQLRDAKKVQYYADAEVLRLEKGRNR